MFQSPTEDPEKSLSDYFNQRSCQSQLSIMLSHTYFYSIK